MKRANFARASDVLDDWRCDVLSGKAPVLYPVGTGALGRIEVGPGLVTLIGGAPGAGKTAFTMQCTLDALRLTPGLKALVCNVEMPPSVLLDRQLSRLSGVEMNAIRHRRIGPDESDRIDQGMNTIAAVSERLCFLRPPYNLENVAATADEFGASLLVLDYIQRIAPPGEHDSRRHSVDATCDYLRQFADAGVSVVVVSAVSRSKDAKGRSSYAGDGLNLASFRESSELEFGADDAFILHPDGDHAEGDRVRLKYLKARHGESRDIVLSFDRFCQVFTGGPDEPAASAPAGADRHKLTSALESLWNRTPALPVAADE